ncbi:MAG: FG-GAP-like repeat-containing protein [Flavobacteriales bacterium]
MRKHYALLGALAMTATTAWSQLSFTNASDRKGTVSASDGCMGVVDMNGDGLDDMAILHNARTFQVDYQNADGSFTLVNYGNVSNAGQWGWAIADIDNNGHKDMISGGNSDGTHYVRITAPGNGALSDLDGPIIFTQAMSIGDIDNNGRLDVYACNDVGPNNLWFSNAGGDLIENSGYINWTTNPSSDMSGNYGSCFSDFDSDGDIDLYIAKCRQGVNDPNDPRRWNRLFVNNGSNSYTDQAPSYGLQIRNQTWTADFGDYDNDGDLDMVATNHDATIQLFENVNNNFVDVTSGCGMEFNGFFLQSKFVDFDNDGFLDVLIAGGDEYFFKGNGDGTFTPISGLFPAGRDMHSFATGDLNNDGFQDVFANYGTGYITPDAGQPDRLWLNDGNDNHWFTVRLKGTISNRDAVGAQVRIIGPWGTQVREVKAGESYGMVTTFACSFGLGEHTTIPTMVIRWPSGLEETFTDLDADQTVTVVENTCISPVAVITTPTAPIVCGNGDLLTLTANEGFDYLWNTGATTRDITVSQAGNYSVTIDDGQGCTATTSIFVEQSPDETPTVTVTGDVRGCEGEEVVLTSSLANGYTWSNGMGNSQSIIVTASGQYAVTIEGVCGTFSSAAVEVDLLDAPDAPLADDVTTAINSAATLEAVGENIEWFTVPVGGSPVATGNTFTTPVLNTNTTYWVSSTTVHGGEIFNGGRINNTTSGIFHTNTDNYQLFTAFEDMIIKSVKVYANGLANRTIAVVDQSNGSTIATGTFSIPAGESRVQLNFNVPAGGPYGLRCVGGNPGLWRDGLGSNPTYPYALGTLGTMTSSTASGNNATAYYYFFYDIEVARPSVACVGPRTQVDVLVGPTAIAPNTGTAAFSVWPNPTRGLINIGLEQVAGESVLEVLDVAGRLVHTTNLDSTLQGQAVVDLSGLAAGTYDLVLRHAEGRQTTRLLIQ